MSNTRKVTKSMENLGLVQKRYIALYRTSFMPWTQYELTSQPNLAKECEERVVAAYKAGDNDEARMQFHRYRSIGVLPTTETWHKFLLLSYKEGNYHDIQSLFYTLHTFGVSPDITSWNFLLDILSKRGLVRKTEEVFWTIMHATQGHVNEFTLRAYFNCLMQEKRYLRAMIAYAGLKEFGYSVDAESLKTLEDFCLQHIRERPGGTQALNVPAEDVAIVEAAFQKDRVTFGHSNVLACSDDLSPAGRDAVLTWYALRATNISQKDAFKIVSDSAQLAWESHVSESLGVDQIRLSVLRGWMQPGDFSINPDASLLLDAALAKGPYVVSTYQTAEGQTRELVLSKADKSKYQRLIVDSNGSPVSSEEASLANEFLKTVKPIDFLRSTL